MDVLLEENETKSAQHHNLGNNNQKSCITIYVEYLLLLKESNDNDWQGFETKSQVLTSIVENRNMTHNHKFPTPLLGI